MFKDVIGRWRTQSLFFETNTDRSEFFPPFTLKDADITRDGKVCVSIKQIYMQLSDPTEYEPAMAILGSWQHWQRLLTTSFFLPIVTQWREELEVKLRSQGVKKVIDSLGDGKQGLSSAKWLADKGWEPVKSKGRPTKEMVAGELKKQSRIQTTLKEDALRVGLQASVN